MLFFLVLLLSPPPGGLSVFVFDGEAGGPVADAQIVVGDTTLTTDSKGHAVTHAVTGTVTATINAPAPLGLQRATTPDLVITPGYLTEALVTLHSREAATFDIEQTALPEPKAAPVKTAEEGPKVTLRGTVVTEKNGAPVVGARIYIRGRDTTATTDSSGSFSLMIPPGTVGVSVVHARFSAATVETQLAPTGGEITLKMAPKTLQLDDVTVVAPYIEGGVAALLDERRNEASVVDMLGAEQMSRSGDSDAAAALSRVTGLTVVGGKYIYVRGMGERYSSTLFNGLALTSPEPERRVVPLDLFPTNVLGSVVVQKTFSPDMPGEFGGGVVRLRARTPPEEPFFQIGISTGYRPDTTFRTGLSYPGGGLDFLGFDDGTRALPGPIAKASDKERLLEGSRISPNGFTAEELETFGESMSNVWETEGRTAMPPLGLSASAGRRFEFMGEKFGILGSAHYGQEWRIRESTRRYFIVGSGGDLELQHTYDFESMERNITAGGLMELSAELGRHHRLAATSLLLRMTDDEARVFEGRNRDVATNIRVTRLRWVERQLFTQQLRGEHDLAVGEGAQINWRYAVSRADRSEPDRRTWRIDQEVGQEDVWLLSDRPEGNQRLYSDLDDTSHDFGGAFRWLLEAPDAGDEATDYLEAGVAATIRERTVDTRRYKFQDKGPRAGDPEIKKLGPEGAFVPENIGNDGFQFQETTRPTDNYRAEQSLQAGYLLARKTLGAFSAMAGLRLERSNQEVETFELFAASQTPSVASLDTTDLLPAASLGYQLREDMQLRAAFGQTVSRPDFRELSEATFNDVTGGRQIFGNPDLDRALIRHYDARWSWYLSARESLSVSAFYKQFENPIETIIIPSAQFSVTYANAKAANNAGVEFEFRKHLGFVSEALEDAYIASNLALIRSRVELSDGGIQTSSERALEGQSPYTLNIQLGYDPTDGDQTATLLYNIAGARIVEVGAQGAPDTLEQPQHRLDFVYGQALGDTLRLKLKAQNLLGAERILKQGPETTLEAPLGRSFSVGLTADF